MKENQDIRKTVGAWLKELRKQKDLTQEEVAFKAKVSVKYYFEVERGLRNITLGNLQRLLQSLNVKKEEAVRLLITEKLSEEDKAILGLAIRIIATGTTKTKLQARRILQALTE